jgi:tripartite-type tricarboxylate transporter receptor subunit TctC
MADILRRRILLAVAGAAVAPSVHAQAYPTKPVTLVVPAAAGMAADVGARFVAERMSRNLGQQVLIDNRPGAGGVIGANVVVGAPPDGHTLLLMVSTYTIQAGLPNKPPYDVRKDFAHIAHIGNTPQMLVASPKSDIRSVADAVARAKAQPINSGSAGTGTTSHLTMEMFKVAAGITTNHVPYKGTQDAQVGLVNGDVVIACDSVPANLPRIRAGQIRPLAVATQRRVPSLPEVPTFVELGYPSMLSASWLAVSAPARTPTAILDMLNAEVRKALADPDTAKRLDDLGFIVTDMSRDQFNGFVEAELEKWANVIRESKVTLQ